MKIPICASLFPVGLHVPYRMIFPQRSGQGGRVDRYNCSSLGDRTQPQLCTNSVSKYPASVLRAGVLPGDLKW